MLLYKFLENSGFSRLCFVPTNLEPSSRRKSYAFGETELTDKDDNTITHTTGIGCLITD